MSDQIPRNSRANYNQDWAQYEMVVKEYARLGVSRSEIDYFLAMNAPAPSIPSDAFYAEIEMLMAKDRAIARVNSRLSQMWGKR